VESSQLYADALQAHSSPLRNSAVRTRCSLERLEERTPPNSSVSRVKRIALLLLVPCWSETRVQFHVIQPTLFGCSSVARPANACARVWPTQRAEGRIPKL
jgi:hypothetical protein